MRDIALLLGMGLFVIAGYALMKWLDRKIDENIAHPIPIKVGIENPIFIDEIEPVNQKENITYYLGTKKEIIDSLNNAKVDVAFLTSKVDEQGFTSKVFKKIDQKRWNKYLGTDIYLLNQKDILFVVYKTMNKDIIYKNLEV